MHAARITSPFNNITIEEWSRVVKLVGRVRKKFCSGNESDSDWKCLKELWVFSDEDRFKPALSHPSLYFIPLLKDILVAGGTGLGVRYSLGCLWYLSRSKSNDLIIGSRELGLIPILMTYLRSRTEMMSYKILRNCVFHPDNHCYMFSDEIGYLSYFKEQMIENPLSVDPYHVFAAVASVIKNENIWYLTRLRIHEVILERIISAGPDPYVWEGKDCGIEDHGLTFLTCFSTVLSGRLALLELYPFDFLYNVSNWSNTMESIRCRVILFNLYGKEISSSQLSPSVFATFPPIEHNISQSQRRSFPEIQALLATEQLHASNRFNFDFFVNIFVATINQNQGREAENLRIEGYDYGMFMMRDLTNLFVSMSLITSESKEFISFDERFLTCVVKTIDLFISNEPELSARNDVASIFAGGGGNDYETVENMLELLLQLSYDYLIDRPEGGLPNWLLHLSGRRYPLQIRNFFLERNILSKVDAILNIETEMIGDTGTTRCLTVRMKMLACALRDQVILMNRDANSSTAEESSEPSSPSRSSRRRRGFFRQLFRRFLKK
jgi:hypothetical protein